MVRINNIKVYDDISDEDVLNIIIKKYKILKQNISEFHICKKSIDARKKDDVHYTYSIDIAMKNEDSFLKYKNISKINSIFQPKIELNMNKSIKPIIIGAGPAGLFAALTFVQNGYKPIIIEQGQSVDERKKSVDAFVNTGILNIHSNVQFGEGGAGTFSDGKLTSGINSPYCKTVLKNFVKFGAPEQILYLTKPHIGTDNLINIIKNIRKYIISNGGQFLFNTKFIDFEVNNHHISKVTVLHLDNEVVESINTNVLILAIGHSSRNTFKKIYDNGLFLEPKNFSVGVRIEHLQSDINKSQYGSITKLKLPAADYKLAYHSTSGRSCYTFCMCPGGVVMPSSSEQNTIVTNRYELFCTRWKKC